MHKAPLDITFYFGTGNEKIERLTRKYIITNWQDEADLRRILDELAAELNYITGYGILEMRVKREDADDVLVDYRSQHKPAGTAEKFYLNEFLFMFSIEVGITTYNNRKVTLNIPRLDWVTGAQNPRPVYELSDTILKMQHIANSRKRKRQTGSSYHLFLPYDDPILTRFLAKLTKDGVLGPKVKRQWSPYESLSIHHIKLKSLPDGQRTCNIREKNRRAEEKRQKQEEREREKAKAAGIVYIDKKKTKKADQIYLIYVVDEHYHNIYKIGMSNEPGKRLDSLRTACPFELELVHRFVATPAEDAEKQLHTQFQANHLRGEWYRLNATDVAKLKQIKGFEDGQFYNSEDVD